MRTYNELSLDERVELQRRLEAGDSLRAIARSLGWAASTISRERRRASSGMAYRAQAAQRRARLCRCQPPKEAALDLVAACRQCATSTLTLIRATFDKLR